jgi:hypothetical protein
MTAFNRRFETRRILERLKAGQRGDVITQEEMTEVAGMECWLAKSRGSRYVYSAIRICLIEHNILWIRNADTGQYECASQEQAIKAASEHNGRARRQAKKCLNKLATVRSDEMTAEQRTTHSLQAMLAGAIERVTSKKAQTILSGRKIDQLDVAQLRMLVGE